MPFKNIIEDHFLPENFLNNFTLISSFLQDLINTYGIELNCSDGESLFLCKLHYP